MPLFSRNVSLGPPLRLSAFRKVAIGTWRTAGDPSVYAILDLEAENAVKYIEKLRLDTGVHVTLAHFLGRAAALTLRRHPQINSVLRLGRLYPRQNVDVFFQVATDAAGQDLSGTTIRQADLKSVVAIAGEMQENVAAIRLKGDPAFRKMKSTMNLLPGFLTGAAIGLTGWLMYTLNVWTSLLGSPRDPFGSVMITNIGSLGLDMAFAPLVPYSRVPLLVTMGALKEMAIVKEGKVVPALILRLCVTFDHRLMDGVHAAHMTTTLKGYFENPELLDPGKAQATFPGSRSPTSERKS